MGGLSAERLRWMIPLDPECLLNAANASASAVLGGKADPA